MNRFSLLIALAALLAAPLASSAEQTPAEAPAAAPEKPAEKAAPAKPAQKATKKKTSKKKKRAKRTGPRRNWPISRPKKELKPMPDFLEVAPYQPGERLKYEVRMFGATAGEAILAVGARREHNGRTLLPLVGFVRSSEFLDKFYPVNDKMVVVLDEATFLPLKVEFDIDENGKKLNYLTEFDHRKKLIRSTRKRGGKTLIREFLPAGPIHEVLGSVFGMRRMKLEPGQQFDYYAWTGLKERLISVRVVGNDRIWTAMGWYDALKIEVTTQLTGGFFHDGKLPDQRRLVGTVWLGTDPARTPLKVVTPTRIGNAEAVLVNRYVEPGKLADTGG